MRPVSHSDLIAVARALRCRPAEMRPWVLDRIICEACAANEGMRSANRSRAFTGDGTLMAAALRRGTPPQFTPADRDYLLCLAQTAKALSRL